MTRLDLDKIRYLEEAELIREALHLIPEDAGRTPLVREHDYQVSINAAFEQFPAKMRMHEPNGDSKVDYAVPLFLDTLYSRDLQPHIQSMNTAEKWAKALLGGDQFVELAAKHEKREALVAHRVAIEAVREASEMPSVWETMQSQQLRLGTEQPMSTPAQSMRM